MTTRSPSNHIDMPPEFDATKYFILAGTETAYQAEEQFDLKQHQRMTSGDYINQFKEVTPKSKKLPKFLKYSPNQEKYGEKKHHRVFFPRKNSLAIHSRSCEVFDLQYT